MIVSSSTPLISVSAVVLDTETTGPDAANARVIQIGAVRIDKGRLVEEDTVTTLVRPGVPILPAAQRVHGIADRDLEAAPSFAEVKPRLDAFIGNRVLIGHSIGFDLAVLKREHEAAGLPWRPPRSLCTQILARAAAPTLADTSLDTVAGWLGIEIENRHSALGDALIAARVFLELVPLLRERGIRTLAEAEELSRSHDDVRAMTAAGWHEPVRPSDEVRRSHRALARIDSYPYRHRVRDLMRTPPVVVAPDTLLKEVLDRLIGERVSSVFVDDPESGRPAGIATERDLLRALHADPDGALRLPVSAIMSAPLHGVKADDLVYRAIGRMDRLGLRHLAVEEEDGTLVGALTTRDLLRQRASKAIALGDGIEVADSVEELGSAWAKLSVVAASLLEEEVDPHDIAAVISLELRGLTRRAAVIAERRMAEAGEGGPPVPYCLLVLGSGGRGESLLAMDQDNAIVYEHGRSDGPEDQWFAALGRHVADILDEVGVPYCRGGVMAKNASWRKSLADWRVEVRDWISRSSPDDLLNTDIFFDARPVHGDDDLARELMDDAFALGHRSASFQKMLTRTGKRMAPPLGWFGRFRTVDGRIDLKGGGLLPIVFNARLLALRHDVREYSTPARLLAVANASDVSRDDIHMIIEAHRIIMGAILRQQLDDIEVGIPPSNKVAPKGMDASERERLRWALGQVETVTAMVGEPFSYD